MPLNWIEKTEKGPISSFIIEKLSDIETVHQYIRGKVNTIPDACSRYPMLGPKQLATRGFTNSVEQMLKRLPSSFQQSTLVHFHGGKNNGELRQALRNWVHRADALQPVTPPKLSPPPPAELAVLIPRCEVAPVALAQYLLSSVPFVMLLPVDLLTLAYSPKLYPSSPHQLIAEKFKLAGKVTILETQMTWIFGNMANCTPMETFANSLRTPAPVTGFTVDGGVHAALADEDVADEVDEALPRTLEAWIAAQGREPEFDAFLETIEDRACRQRLWICAPDNASPKIIVPASCQEALIRDVHETMFHLNHQKVAFTLERSYYWPDLRKDTRRVLADCPACELTKARQNSAHGLFRSLPSYAPRVKWCMDFQGQGQSLTGEKEALALIDPMSRYVVVLPLADREAATWLQPFLDHIVFRFGAPEVLHSDAAPEFLSEALQLLAKAADIHTTTTMGHYARGNGTIEVFWRFWNRCLRLLPDDHYARWPSFATRIAFAFNTAPQDSTGQVTPFQVQHGGPARSPFPVLDGTEKPVDEDKELQLPALFAQAVAVSTQIFCQLAKTHDDFIRRETALRLNKVGSIRTFKLGDKVKIRVPPTQEQMLATGRRAKHITAWRGPCTIVERLSPTAYAAVDDVSKRRHERLIANLLPYRAKQAKVPASAQAFNEQYSDPFVRGEYIAIRDDKHGPFYVAEITAVTRSTIKLHYYGCREILLPNAVFRPCWHAENAGRDPAISLHHTAPGNQIPYSGTVDLKDIRQVLVARNLEFTAAWKLRFRSQRALAPVQDQLFRFAR
jgi:transposase InsO family protein